MQVLKQHKIVILVAVLLVVVLVVSFFVVQNSLKSTPSATPSPGVSSTPSPSPTPTTIPILSSGEVIQFQGQNLTSISAFVKDLVQHPDVSIAGVQNINQATYRLSITGLVNQTMDYTYDDVVNNFTSYQKVATLPCVEGWSATVLWQGVRLSDILQKAGASSNATTLIFYASDGYTTALPMDYVMQNNIMIAYKMNNVTLTTRTGWPFFLVAQNQYGYKWIMWLTRIDVSNDSSYLGYWESQGYPNNATVISG